jgi:hypothetical protein
MATRSWDGRRRSRSRALGFLFLLGSVLGFGLATLGPAGAAPLVYESFEYDAGTVLDGVAATGQNLTGSYVPLGSLAAQKLVVQSPGLDYGSLIGAPTASGNRVSDVQGVTAAGATVSLDDEVVVGPGEAIFWSALFTLDDSENGNHLANITLTDDTTGDFLFFGEPGVGVGGLRVAANTAAIGGLLADGADNAFTDGATLLLVGRYVNSAAPDGDTLDLIVYDTSAATVLPTSFDPTDPNAAFAFELAGLDIDLARITSIAFTIRGADNNFIDELRIGTTYADVVPEPAAAALLGLGLSGLGLHGRARRERISGRGTAPPRTA